MPQYLQNLFGCGHAWDADAGGFDQFFHGRSIGLEHDEMFGDARGIQFVELVFSVFRRLAIVRLHQIALGLCHLKTNPPEGINIFETIKASGVGRNRHLALRLLVVW